MKKINLGPGPSYIPEDINKELISSVFDDGERGFSIIHQSHRSDEFEILLNKFKEQLRCFLNVPNTHEVLIVQGGATLTFSLLAQNFSHDSRVAQYLVSGFWSNLAAENASKIKNISIADIKGNIKSLFKNSSSKEWSYFHYVMNETVNGFFIDDEFELDCPIICDASSSLFGNVIDINKFDMIYSSSSKHLAVPGFTIVIIKKDLFSKLNSKIPEIMSYEHWRKTSSIPCTPPTVSIYFCNEILKNLISKGDLGFHSKQNNLKASLIYNFLDNSKYFSNNIESKYRSKTNFVFEAKNSEIESSFTRFLDEKYSNFIGHESTGGFRFNTYNLFSIDQTKSLIEYADSFQY